MPVDKGLSTKPEVSVSALRMQMHGGAGQPSPWTLREEDSSLGQRHPRRGALSLLARLLGFGHPPV
jgi:hypothetical protein